MIRVPKILKRLKPAYCIVTASILCGSSLDAESETGGTFIADSAGQWTTAKLLSEGVPGESNSLLVLPNSTGLTNVFIADSATNEIPLKEFKDGLTKAHYLVETRQFSLAEPALVKLLDKDVPDSIQRGALFELGAAAQGEKDLPRAESIYEQFLNRWSDDVRVPEVLLRQGQIFREMGLNELALGKFYSVMTAALSLKESQLEYYQQLVLQAQIEIAETNFQSGKYAEAADYYSRLLENATSPLDYTELQYLLIRALVSARSYERAAGEAQDFLGRHPNAAREPEVRYYLAESFKEQGRNGDALQQVLLFLKEEKAKASAQPEVWAYWQERVGNEIGNQLYQEGEYFKALDIYLNLAKLDSSPGWQLPVEYQIGLTYERLLQPKKARDVYKQIIAREANFGTNATPELATVLDMSRWRVGFIDWQSKAETDYRSVVGISVTNEQNLP